MVSKFADNSRGIGKDSYNNYSGYTLQESIQKRIVHRLCSKFFRAVFQRDGKCNCVFPKHFGDKYADFENKYYGTDKRLISRGNRGSIPRNRTTEIDGFGSCRTAMVLSMDVASKDCLSMSSKDLITQQLKLSGSVTPIQKRKNRRCARAY